MTYTPSTDDIRERYADNHLGSGHGRARDEFDRWFAAEEARIRADERRRIAEAIWDRIDWDDEDYSVKWINAGLRLAHEIAES